MNSNKSIIESILFISGEPVSIKLLADTLKITEKEILIELDELSREKYSKDSSGININILGKLVTFTTNDSNYNIISDFFNYDKQKQLTNAALEVLSIIAYKQPVTKSEIDDIRGVKSDHIISKLISDGFIYISGKLDAPGIPNLYSTTERFLLKFNISSLEELPQLNYTNDGGEA